MNRSGQTLQAFVVATRQLGDGFAFDLDVQRPGESSQVRVKTRGAFDVLCHIHPKMKLRVRVQ